jgi:glutathione peroxidase
MLLTTVVTLLAGSGPAEPPGSLHALSVETIDRKPLALSTFKGKVLLVVNTASECGNTPQYAGLEKLHQTYKGKGFAVLGFPSNDFGGQEPGSEEEIKRFCSVKYRVTFPMFAKVKTKGEGQSAVYRFLTAAHGLPKWNFHKYLVGKDGKVIRAFGDKVQPDAADLLAAIDGALGAK